MQGRQPAASPRGGAHAGAGQPRTRTGGRQDGVPACRREARDLSGLFFEPESFTFRAKNKSGKAHRPPSYRQK